MTYKIDKTLPFDINKNNELIAKSEDMDIQDILQYSLINKFPITLVIDNAGNNLIHLTINNPKTIKTEFNKLNFIKFLMQNDVNPDQPNKNNQTPLHLACQYQYFTIVKLLLESKVNSNYKDNNGLTPLHYLYTGNIQLLQEKEIKEFIIPNKTKDNKFNREDYVLLKQHLWANLKTNYIDFFESLKNTIEENIRNNNTLKKEINKFKIELSGISTTSDKLLINDKYKNFKSALYDINEKNWNKFPNDEDIVLHEMEINSLTIDSQTGIIKNADVKKQIKTKIKETISEFVQNISNVNYNKYNIKKVLLEFIQIIIFDIVKLDRIVSIDIYNNLAYNNGTPLLNITNYLQPLNNFQQMYISLYDDSLKYINAYQNITHSDAIDLADNIIDLKNLSFIGGSRQITITYVGYNIIINNIALFNTINQTVIYILMCFFINDFINNPVLHQLIINYIANFNINAYDNTFNAFINNVNSFTTNPAFTLFYIRLCKLCYETIFNYDNNIQNKDKQLLYSIYIRGVTSNSHNNLDVTIHEIIILLFSALMNNSNSNLFEESLLQINKIRYFSHCVNAYISHIEAVAVWAGVLLDNKNIIINPFNPIDAYLTDINIDESVKNIMKNIVKGTDLKNTANDIIEYYENLTNKFPKLYLMDLIYYVLDPNKLATFKNNANFLTDPIIFIQTQIVHNNLSYDPKNNLLYNFMSQDFPPSMSSFLYVILDDLFNVNSFVNNVIPQPPENIYLFSKYTESCKLGLLFYGCIPDISIHLKSNNVFFIDIDNVKPINENKKNVTLIFNPDFSMIPNLPNFNQNPNNINIGTILPFNYFYDTTNTNNYEKKIYFKYTDNRYRPSPSFLYAEYLKLLIFKFNTLLDDLLNSNKINYLKILKTFFIKKHKISSMFNTLYVLVKLIIEKQKSIISLDPSITNNINFNFALFIDKLNNINAHIFLYYYLYKNDRMLVLPEFLYYKLDSDNYKLFDNPFYFANTEMIGGTYKNLLAPYYVNNITVIPSNIVFAKHSKLPPSLEDNLTLFYKLNKKKFIIDILTMLKNKNPAINDIWILIENNFKSKLMINESDKNNFIYLNVAKLIEEIIKNYAEYVSKITIDNIMVSYISNLPDIIPEINIVEKPFEIPMVLNNNVNIMNNIYNNLTDANKEILKNFYNIVDNNIANNDNGKVYIIYPNEYNNTNLLLQKYCITFNDDILNELLNNNAQPLLLDNNNFSCIHNAVKTFNYKSIKLLTDKIQFNEYEFIKNELINHQNKMISNTHINTFNNFIKTQYEEIKLLILSNDSNGNNILFNLHNSFKICFYIMNEYITDYLWQFDNKYLFDDFANIAAILNINKNNIYENYLNIISNQHKNEFANDDITLIKNELIGIINENNNKLTTEYDNLNIQKENIKKLGLSYININNKMNRITANIANNRNKIISLTNITSNVYINPPIGQKKKIINTYDKLTNKGHGVYSKLWDFLLNNENLLSHSFNLSLIKILMAHNDANSHIVLSYLDHLELLASNYFENPKYINSKINKSLSFIYDLLIHLTKTIICFGIEIITKKILFNHLINVYDNYSLDDINGIINRLFNDNYNIDGNGSFMDILYNEYPEIIVKNSINLFSNLEEKINFEPISVNEMLQNLFRLLNNSREIVILDDIIMNNLNKNIANYFDLFTNRLVKNWFIVCENILKFIINHQRIANTLIQFKI